MQFRPPLFGKPGNRKKRIQGIVKALSAFPLFVLWQTGEPNFVLYAFLDGPVPICFLSVFLAGSSRPYNEQVILKNIQIQKIENNNNESISSPVCIRYRFRAVASLSKYVNSAPSV